MNFLVDLWGTIIFVVVCTVTLTGILYLIHDPVTLAEGTVLMVGGCDKHGYCKVMMEDGAMGMVHYPVTGQRCRYQVEKE